MLPRLVLITDRRRTPRPLTDSVQAALEAIPPGSAMLLLREKDLPGAQLLALALRLRAVTAAHGTPLIVSTRCDVALAVGADGVHLGGDAPPCDHVISLVRGKLLVGVSLHGNEVAPSEASYAFMSPVFPTASKPLASPIGLAGLRSAIARNGSTPIFGLGGIADATAARACRKAGAYGAAVLGAVLTSDEPGTQARTMYEALS